MTRGFCLAEGSEARKAAATSSCARDLVHALGRNTVVVKLPQPSSNLTNPVASDFGQGGLLHFRGNDKLSSNLLNFNAEAEEEGIDIMQGEQAVTFVAEQRVDQFQWMSVHNDDGVLVQDWSMLEVMGSALLDVLERKRKWGPIKWFAKGRHKKRRVVNKGQRSDSHGLRLFLGAVWLAFAFLVVRPAVRRGYWAAGTTTRIVVDGSEYREPLVVERRASGWLERSAVQRRPSMAQLDD